MKILVCLNHVPDTTTKITFTNNNTELNTAGVQFILNPYDEIALSRAIELNEGGKGNITVIHVGEVASETTIRKALAIGADDAVRVNAVPRDAYFVAYQIATYAKDKNFDLILTGRESIDYNGAQVAAMIGEFLAIPSICIIKKLDFDGTIVSLEREIEGGQESICVPTPLVASCSEGVSESKIPTMRGIMSARTKPLAIIETTGLKTFLTFDKFSAPTPRSTIKMFSSEEINQLVNLLHSEAKVI